MIYQYMSPIKDYYDKIYTIYNCLIDLGRKNFAEIIIKNKDDSKIRLERYARFVLLLALKKNRSDLVEELEFSGLIYS